MKKIALLLVLAISPSLANANLLINGSFEAESQAAGTWGIYANLTGWTGQNDIELRNNVAGTASEGVNFVELDTTKNNSMFQVVSTTAGLTYNLSFDYAARAGVTSASNPIKAFWNGIELVKATGSGIGKTGNNWVTLDFEVIATGNDKLTFSAVGTSDSYGGSLDNVVLTSAVPEPSTYGMMLAGLGLIGFSAGRRMR
ncbi:MAG: FxDxF family PEP-CTERM protein [Candidatus Methylopumilus sp.]|jgi:hypothetical protein